MPASSKDDIQFACRWLAFLPFFASLCVILISWYAGAQLIIGGCSSQCPPAVASMYQEDKINTKQGTNSQKASPHTNILSALVLILPLVKISVFAPHKVANVASWLNTCQVCTACRLVNR